MPAKINIDLLDIGVESAIQIGNRVVLIILFALRTGILPIRLALRILALDEDITRAGIYIEAVGYSLDGHVDGEEVAHGVDAMGFRGRR